MDVPSLRASAKSRVAWSPMQMLRFWTDVWFLIIRLLTNSDQPTLSPGCLDFCFVLFWKRSVFEVQGNEVSELCVNQIEEEEENT